MKKKSIFTRFLYSQKVAPYVFISPFIITFLIFFLYSIISMIIMSFQQVGGGTATFIGLENYTKILGNSVFRKSIRNSALYTVLSCALMIPLPMILAIMLNSKQMKGKTVFRSMLFVPALTSVVVSGMVFRLMFGELEGAFMNRIIGSFGFDPIVWLRNPITVWIVMCALCIWRWTGVNMMYYLSGLQQIPEELYEAAIVDGASALQKFVYVTFPLLKPTMVYVLTISIFGGMAMFSESFMVFNGNKSPNNIGTTLVGMLYRMGFEQGQLGIGSAIGVVFLVIVLAVNAVQLIGNGFFKKEER